MAESCIERMQRIDSKRKIADFIVKEKQDYTYKKEVCKNQGRRICKRV